MTPDQEKRALQLLVGLADNECQFSYSRHWTPGKSCGEDNGRGFDCFKCQARALIAEITAPGKRVELHPGHNLWIQGARCGQVKKVDGKHLLIKMDNPQVKRLVRVLVDNVKFL